MKRHTTVDNQIDSNQRQHSAKFVKVLDGRKQPIRGLWKRGERFYAQLMVENPVTGVKRVKRVPMVDKDNNPVQTVAQAVEAMKRLQVQRTDGSLPSLDRVKKFKDYAADYLKNIAAGEGAKAPATVSKEKTAIARWIEHLGEKRLNQIKRVHINSYVRERRQEVDNEGNPKYSNRTINLDVIALRCVLKDALDDGLIQILPMAGMKPLDEKEVKRPLFTAAMLDKLCSAAFEMKKDKQGKDVPITQNAQEFADYVKVMAYSGARRNEALGIQWDDVDFSGKGKLYLRRQVTHRGIEPLKNGEERSVDMNPKLRAHLEDMATRLQPDSKWLFPSPQRGEKDLPAKTFKESMVLVRERAGLPDFGFHDCRHHFISMCVMSGIDFMTIAAWAGHKDGGVLIGKVYGHLANEHRENMAAKLNFGPAILPSVVNE